MSGHSDFESIVSDVVVSPCSSSDDLDASSTNRRTKPSTSQAKNTRVDDDEEAPSACSPALDASFTDSDHSLLGVPKQLNASSPSSVCSAKPLEWDSGADVGYDMTSRLQSQDLSTIERIAVSNLVYNANSTPIDYVKRIKTKSSSLINLNESQLSRDIKSASFEALKRIALKCDTLPKCRSPMNSSLSVSTVVHKLKLSGSGRLKQTNDADANQSVERRRKEIEKLSVSPNTGRKSSDSSKESNSTFGSADTAGSWVAKEFQDSTNTTTDRVNSFEYLPGNTYYNGRDNEYENYSDKEIKQSTKMLVEIMKQNGLTDESQRKKIFKDIVTSFLEKYAHNISSSSDTNCSLVRPDYTPPTSITANTVVNNHTNNQSSTITFTSPITSSPYGDDVDSKYDESSMDSGRHIDLKKCKSKKMFTLVNKPINQGVKCTIRDNSNLTSSCNDEILKKSTSTNVNSSRQVEENSKSNVKCKMHKGTSKEFKKQMIWFHTNYMKTERENQMLWINNQISHLNNLKKLLNTHEELKKSWNSFKQKQTVNNKPKSRRNLIPLSSSSSDFTNTTRTDSSVSCRQSSVTSKCYDTDVESSATICDHVHYKKSVAIDEPKSMKKCCENTLRVIEEEEKECATKFKTACTQTKPIKETIVKNHRKDSTNSGETYTVDHHVKLPARCKSSISYDIIFKPTLRSSKEISFDNKFKQKKPPPSPKVTSVACQTNKVTTEPKSSLQEYLVSNRPDYICRAEERQNILSDLVSLRDERKKLKRDLLITNRDSNKVPPNPLAVKRVMSQREMRKQTERKYRNCPEVKNKKVEIKRKEEYKTNKIMANIFNKRLQKKTLKGKVDLSNSVSVCSL